MPLNYLNLHFIFHIYSLAIADLFGPVYFFKIGIPLKIIFFWWALFFLVRLIFRPFVLYACRYLSIKWLFIFSAFMFAGTYTLYQFVKGPDGWLLFLLIYNAIVSTIYWTIYHAYFAALGTIETRGRQVALRDSLTQLAVFAAPVSAGLLIESFSFTFTFYFASCASLIGTVPLLKLPKMELPVKTKYSFIPKRMDLTGFKLYLAESINVYGHVFAWKLVVFILIGSYAGFGGLMGLAVVLQMVCIAISGVLFDRGRGKMPLAAGISLALVTLAGRSFLAYTVPVIIFFDLIFALGNAFYGPVINAINYNASKGSNNTVTYQFFAESGWDLGATAVTASIGILLHMGGELRTAMLLGGIGLSLYGVFLKEK